MSESLKERRPSALIIGASAGIGRALAGELAAVGFDLFLVARDALDLEAVAGDCRIRHNIWVETFSYDLGASESAAAVGTWLSQLGARPERVFLVAGASLNADSGIPTEAMLERMLKVNFTGVAQIGILAANEAANWSLRLIAVCSTIAVPVPRGRNLAYATAKAALETLVQGLRHILASQDVIVQIYRLGYIDTSLTFGQKLLFRRASPEVVARRMVRWLDCNFGMRYFPRYWFWIVTVLRLLPWMLYKRLSF